ncbi:glutaredoxin [Pacificibacter maritimus]|uniref:Methylamine utilization protein MauE n=1 Tax=Pacificibacter maritimus TaxID=762213 RepID=A0A3N4UWP9_9RHOB|nr:glutaredoxin [Pacificibacter maritimus]RPE71959.1 glutaredoxin [Pacificibacter maritimus]
MTPNEPLKKAVLHRMAIGKSMCPHGLKAKDLLKRQGFDVEDHLLTTRADVDAFKAAHSVTSTPQIFIDGTRIGGFDDLKAHLGLADTATIFTPYRPVIALFAIAALMACVVAWLSAGGFFSVRLIELFVAISMVLLGLQKLQDVDRFATMFLGYDLLARRWVRYSYIYPFVETGAGLLMMAGVFTWLSAPSALIISTIGAISVFKAVYIDKRSLKCACVGGDSQVPLGFVSLLENLMMMGMAIWMLSQF